MTFPRDFRLTSNPGLRATSQREVASYQGMGGFWTRRRARILIVDDNPSIAALMSQLLTMRGYDVITASSAEQAEAEVRKQLPDLILSDVMMPGKSGYEFCQGLKENPDTRLIPFVLITGLSDSTDKVRGIEAGADDFLNKPVLAEELIARVKSLLRLKEFTDELETADAVLCTLGLIVEGRDPYTEGHCERLSVRARRMGDHEASSRYWREHLQAAAFAAAGVAHHSPPPRTLRWFWLSGWLDRNRDSGTSQDSAGRRCVRRASHCSLLQSAAHARASRADYERRSSARPLGC